MGSLERRHSFGGIRGHAEGSKNTSSRAIATVLDGVNRSSLAGALGAPLSCVSERLPPKLLPRTCIPTAKTLLNDGGKGVATPSARGAEETDSTEKHLEPPLPGVQAEGVVQSVAEVPAHLGRKRWGTWRTQGKNLDTTLQSSIGTGSGAGWGPKGSGSGSGGGAGAGGVGGVERLRLGGAARGAGGAERDRLLSGEGAALVTGASSLEE